MTLFPFYGNANDRGTVGREWRADGRKQARKARSGKQAAGTSDGERGAVFRMRLGLFTMPEWRGEDTAPIGVSDRAGQRRRDCEIAFEPNAWRQL